MAELSEEILTIILELQRRLAKLINQASATELLIFEKYGETVATMTTLEQLSNIKERATSSYSRLSNLLLRISEIQPKAPPATLELLSQTIEQAQATADAGEATVQEAKPTGGNYDTNSPLPNPEKVERTVTKMREVCRQFDTLNIALDELIAQIELDIRNSPLTCYREGRKKTVRQLIEEEIRN